MQKETSSVSSFLSKSRMSARNRVRRHWTGKPVETGAQSDASAAKTTADKQGFRVLDDGRAAVRAPAISKSAAATRRKATPAVILRRTDAQHSAKTASTARGRAASSSSSSSSSASSSPIRQRHTAAVVVRAGGSNAATADNKARAASNAASAADKRGASGSSSSSESESDSEIERRRARARARQRERTAESTEPTKTASGPTAESDDDSSSEVVLPSQLHKDTSSTAAATSDAAAASSSGSYESYSYESDSDDGVAAATLFRPVFVKKSERGKAAEPTTAADQLDEHAAEHERLKDLRRVQARDALKRDLEQEAVARSAAQQFSAADDGLDTDPTDGAALAAEYEAWRLRELARVKRDLDARNAERAEQAELARRRAMTDEEIMREDADRLRRNKRDKSKMKFMQRYYHEGAFFRDGDDGDILEGRDFTAPTQEDVIDKSVLPKAMQVRRGVGLQGHTRYTHLADQDTSDRKNDLWFSNDKLARRYRNKQGGTDDRAAKKRRHH